MNWKRWCGCSHVSQILAAVVLSSSLSLAQLPATLTANDVFNPFTQMNTTWVFQNQFGDQTWIEVTGTIGGTAGYFGNNVVFHYMKSSARAYWNPSVFGDELWYMLHQWSDGSWTAVHQVIGSNPNCTWCPDQSSRFESTDFHQVPGFLPGPLIIPAVAESSQTITVNTGYSPYWEFGAADWAPLNCCGGGFVPWTTSTYIENVTTPIYAGPAMVSEQWENCPGPGCAHEKWYFGMGGIGLVKVIPTDPTYTITRIN